MKLIEYKTLPELEATGLELYETNTSWSHRVFEDSGHTIGGIPVNRCAELHIFNK